MKRPAQVFRFGKALIGDFIDDDCPRMAAALAYYAIFSLPAILGLLVWAARAVSIRAFESGVVSSIAAAFGPSGADVIGKMVELSQIDTSGGILATLLSLALLLFGATRGFAELQEALNKAWEVRSPPERHFAVDFLLHRALSFVALAGVFVMVVASLGIAAGLELVENAVPVMGSTAGEAARTAVRAVGYGVSFALLAVTFTLLYRVVPDAEVAWRDAFAGAIFTTLLFNLGRWGFGLYVSSGDVTSPFGAAGAFAAVLLWVYSFALIVLLGAEFTQAWSRFRGRPISPARGAVRVGETRPAVVRDVEAVRPT